MSGVVDALDDGARGVSTRSRRESTVVMIGTTHFTNAVVQRRDLAPTAAVRLGLPATASLPPMVDWPEDLRASRSATTAISPMAATSSTAGAISPLDEARTARHRRRHRGQGHQHHRHHLGVLARQRATSRSRPARSSRKALPGAHITLSSEIGRIGLLERENAAIMNACLRDLSAQVIDAFREAIARAGIKGRFYLTQNDGTLMDAASPRHSRC